MNILPNYRLQIHRTVLFLLLATATLAWQVNVARIEGEEPQAHTRIHADLATLADDSMQGRGIGTEGLRRAAELIARRFEVLGLKTDLADGGPYQVFNSTTRVPKVAQGVDWEAIHAADSKASGTAPAAGTMPSQSATGDTMDESPEKPERPERRSVEVKNVLGLLPGEGPFADEIIVVGAHYDHLGYREKNGKVTVFNGANDNASGTAAVLEIARILSQREKKLPRSVLFIAFSAEERGLVGSFFYVKHPILPVEKTIAMINLDMVGCMEGKKIMASGSGTSKLLTQMVIRAAREADLNLIEMPGSIGGSDHVPFYAHEVPVVHFITTGGWKKLPPTDRRRGNRRLRGHRAGLRDGRGSGCRTGRVGTTSDLQGPWLGRNDRAEPVPIHGGRRKLHGGAGQLKLKTNNGGAKAEDRRPKTKGLQNIGFQRTEIGFPLQSTSHQEPSFSLQPSAFCLQPT